MAGLYLHIPFCRQACHYCDFHFSTTLKSKPDLVAALCKELLFRKDESNQIIETIYFGGGTPSLLSKEELNIIFTTIFENYEVSKDAEITLEANPDDLTKIFLRELRVSPVNRLSIGIQSFNDKDLQFMNRAHTASEAVQCVHYAAEEGYSNLSIDLIYGVPGMSLQEWELNLETALKLPVNHLSAYCLTVEEGTALAYKIKIGTAKNVNDEMAAEHFKLLLSKCETGGIPWYEISNFAKPGFKSRHNSAYWSGKPYIGIGPSAHSFNGYARSWNVSSNQAYIASINAGNAIRESETLSVNQRINEKILTALRTRNGLTLSDIRAIDESVVPAILKSAEKYISEGALILHDDNLSLTLDGLLFADAIAAGLFV